MSPTSSPPPGGVGQPGRSGRRQPRQRARLGPGPPWLTRLGANAGPPASTRLLCLVSVSSWKRLFAPWTWVISTRSWQPIPGPSRRSRHSSSWRRSVVRPGGQPRMEGGLGVGDSSRIRPRLGLQRRCSATGKSSSTRGVAGLSRLRPHRPPSDFRSPSPPERARRLGSKSSALRPLPGRAIPANRHLARHGRPAGCHLVLLARPPPGHFLD